MLFAFAYLIAQVVAHNPSSAPATAHAVVSPCPSASPVTAGSANAPTPGATGCAPSSLREIGRASVTGRKANLVGKAQTASQGTIDQEQIATRPILRPGEVLEAIPGLVISQHSGEGKANQYYLRGFQLDHGTDLESNIVGIPVNLPTHAHGQGYSDINYLIPELVSYVEFKKGTYFADQGDFSTAGSYNLYLRNTIAPTTEFGIGDFGYERLFTATTSRVAGGNLLSALELYHNNGTYAKPDEYHKINAVLRYSKLTPDNDFALTALGYNGPFNSTDQIPQREVQDGTLSHYGYVDPSDGGNTYRYALALQVEHRDAHGKTNFNAYGVQSFLDLFSNFTYNFDDATDYYNVTRNPVTCNPAYTTCTANGGSGPRVTTYNSYCPANNTAPAGATAGSISPAPFSFSCGDQREQVDRRFYSGFGLSHTFNSPGATTTAGIGLRNDTIAEVGLFLDNSRVRYPNGMLSHAKVLERTMNAYVQSDIRFGKLRVLPGLRADSFNYTVHDQNPANSGSASTALLSPKFNLAYALDPHDEFYVDYGSSYHSNDARGVIGMDDPQTLQTVDASGTVVGRSTPITRAFGQEVGYRFSVPKLTTTISYYQLRLADELVFQGDAGTTSLGGPTLRKGIEFTNFYTPTRWLTIDADIATATANFTTNPDNVGTAIPESLNNVDSLGATVDLPTYSASLRMRYFGPRALENTGVFKSNPSTLFNGQFTQKFRHDGRLTLDIYNILNAQADDVEYYYGSWTRQDAQNPALASDPTVNPALGGGGVNDYHVHPSEKRTVRLTLGLPL